ncbi:MAG: hypothetical protein JXO72_01190 [Vicinamibacteria bacterium]|nr:hypothetical protein [Vicinamibacteria bacterium]
MSERTNACARAGLAFLVAGFLMCDPASTQFIDEFGGPAIHKDWTHFTGDGSAAIDFQQSDGYGTMLVDGVRDRDNIWWALIKRDVASSLDLKRLGEPGHELRLEARVRIHEAPRRVHLSANTQKTTDYHEHLREFDIIDATGWHTISMTTRGFRAEPGDEVNVQFAITDWGLGKYQADVDYYKVDVVDTASVGPDKGEPQQYHPPVPDLGALSEKVRVAQDSTVSLQYRDVNLNDWFTADNGRKATALTVNGAQIVILRWDLRAYAGQRAAGAGVLELSTHSVARAIVEPEELGQVRVTEILGGDPDWDQRTVTLDSLLQGQPLDAVLNPQMIIDERVAEGRGVKTLASISRPVLQRLLDGRTLGLAIRPLGPIDATFYSSEHEGGSRAATLHFNLQ